MNGDDAARWDERYRSGDYRPRTEPTALVVEAARLIGGGRALVLACGAGRNAICLASAGFEVVAVDISSVAIDMAREEASRRGVEVDWRVGDVGEFRLDPGRHDLITMIRYTNREVWPLLADALTPDGWVLMEQHLRTRHPVIGPSGEYRLAPGELLEAFGGLRVIRYFEEFDETEPGRAAATAGLLACKGDPGW